MHRTPRFLLDVVEAMSTTHNSAWIADSCSRFNRGVFEGKMSATCQKGFYSKKSTQTKNKVFNSFNFQFLPRNPPFSTFQTGHHQGSPWSPSNVCRNLICIEPYCGKSASRKCDRTKSVEAPQIEKLPDLFWVERINFCFGTYINAKQYADYIWLFIMVNNMQIIYESIYCICKSKQLVSSLCVANVYSWTPSFWNDFWMVFFW